MKGGEVFNVKKPEREIVRLNKWRDSRISGGEFKSVHVVASVIVAILIYALLLAAGL